MNVTRSQRAMELTSLSACCSDEGAVMAARSVKDAFPRQMDSFPALLSFPFNRCSIFSESPLMLQVPKLSFHFSIFNRNCLFCSEDV